MPVRRVMAPLHILVTDDDLDKRMLLSRGVAREFPHASIFECHSGKEALEYYAANRVDAIITDHNMQPVDGIELIRTLRHQGAKLPIIMVSGHEEMRESALAAGADLFLGTEDLLRIGKPIAEFLRNRGCADGQESD